jgi:hypothetical protein
MKNIAGNILVWACIFICLGHIPRSGVAGSCGDSFLLFGEATSCFSKEAAPFHIAISCVKILDFCISLSMLSIVISITCIPVKCYIVVVLICISLMANDVDHPFMSLSFAYLPWRNVGLLFPF